MKVKIVPKADANLLERIDVKGLADVATNGATLSKVSLGALRRERCKETDLEQWASIRNSHFTAGGIKNFLPKQFIGAEKNGKRRSRAHQSFMSDDARKKEEEELKDNPYCVHGRMYQLEGAMVYAAVTDKKIAPIGCLTGPLPADGDFAEVPKIFSATLDYIDLYTDTVVEIKCPQRIHYKWQDLYWAQIQTQLQLSRCSTAHLVQYIPPVRDVRGQIHITVINVDHRWFQRIIPELRNKAKSLKKVVMLDDV